MPASDQPEICLLFLWECCSRSSEEVSPAAVRGVSPEPALMASASFRQSSSALAVAFANLDLASKISFSCVFAALFILHVDVASFFSSAALSFASFLVFWLLTFIWVLVGTLAPVQRGQGPGGAWMGMPCSSLARKVKSSSPLALREVPWLVVEVAVETLGVIPNPLSWREEQTSM
jgi:hypothetical protein